MPNLDARDDYLPILLEDIEATESQLRVITAKREELINRLAVLRTEKARRTAAIHEVAQQAKVIHAELHPPPEGLHPDLVGIHPKTRAYKEITLRLVRDWYANSPVGWIKSGEIAAALKVSTTTVGNRTQELLAKGIVEWNGKARGGSKYRYVKPSARPQTANRPRLEVVGQRPRSAPIPGTGKAMGPSGKPGQDKKNSAKGKRVKRARQGT